jgi:DnaJ-domain-containing protein 1
MKGLSKIVGGFLGFLLAGPGGCLLGILIGHIFDKNMASPKKPNSWRNSSTKSNDEKRGHINHPSNLNLIQAYRVLDITRHASQAEVKHAYRRSMNRYHPDRLAQKNLSPRELQQATQKAQHIKDAYEFICSTEDFS